ncbi:MAG: hypothetical protein MET45_08410 [Nostoc sp. LLA-1]|nr:hypothetical protein [Cyanocohniella sp. LLY]
MTVAQQIRIPNNEQVNANVLHQISKLIAGLFKGLWWHLQAYTSVFSIMLLTFASLFFLYVHYSGRKLTQVLPNNIVIEQK